MPVSLCLFIFLAIPLVRVYRLPMLSFGFKSCHYAFQPIHSSILSISLAEEQPFQFAVGPYVNILSLVMRKPVLPYANNKGADQPAHP